MYLLAIGFARKIPPVRGAVGKTVWRFVSVFVVTLAVVLSRYLFALVPVLIIVVPVGLLVTWIPEWLGMSPKAADNVALFGVALLFFIFFVLPFIMNWYKRRHPARPSRSVRLYDAWDRLFPPPWRGR